LAEPPTAALAYNDVVAIGAIHALAERGRAAGRDFAVVGFDDIAEARQMEPPLTTVAVNGEGLGERVGRVLFVRVFHAVYLPEHLRGWRFAEPVSRWQSKQ
jgi:LacI family transcriptional regulator